jgi:hypothetical protein
MRNDLAEVRKQYEEGVSAAYKHDVARANEVLSAVNGRVSAYGDAHRIVQELQSAPSDWSNLSPFRYPYLTALAHYGPDEFVRRCTNAFALHEQSPARRSTPTGHIQKSRGYSRTST